MTVDPINYFRHEVKKHEKGFQYAPQVRLQPKKQNPGRRLNTKDIIQDDNVIENQPLFQHPLRQIAFKQTLDVFDSIKVLIEFMHASTRRVVVKLHGVQNDVIVSKIAEFH
jgi:hypothetical protein